MNRSAGWHRACPYVLLACLLGGCATEWQTGHRILPLSGTPAATREANSIGVLARLAVMRVEMNARLTDAQQADPRWTRRLAEMGDLLQQQVTDYLVRAKGYEAQAVDVHVPGDEDQRRALATDLQVDGLVRIERYFVPAWSTTELGINLLLLNAPLARRLREVTLRVSVYEGRSGFLVWVKELRGQSTDTETRVDPVDALRDLDNAVPRQLRR